MGVEKIVSTDKSVSKGCSTTAVGVQGKQGHNRYNHQYLDSEDISYITKTVNTMNIYNYFGESANLLANGAKEVNELSGAVYNFPSDTFAYAYFDTARYGGSTFTVLPEGVIVPFQTESYFYIRNMNGYMDYGSYLKFGVYDEGIYEITYQVYFKNEASVGARLLKDEYVISSSVITQENKVLELTGTCFVYCMPYEYISLDLFSESELEVTLKGGLGAAILIKKLSNN